MLFINRPSPSPSLTGSLTSERPEARASSPPISPSSKSLGSASADLHCLVVDLPVWKVMEFVSWHDDIPNCFWKVILNSMVPVTSQLGPGFHLGVPSGNLLQFAIENGYWNSWYPNLKMVDLSIVMRLPEGKDVFSEKVILREFVRILFGNKSFQHSGCSDFFLWIWLETTWGWMKYVRTKHERV